MKIQKIKIGNFGKLENVQLDFTPGLNIIYGENEAGKSTLQAFMKAIFYGMDCGKKDIKENERKKYLPWNGKQASGELHFLDEKENPYIIKRSFNEKRKKDEASVLHGITGDEIKYIDEKKPGKDIFGLGESAFEKTVFIKQLGSQVARDKEDEIMNRLSNLQQSGDENTSYFKAANKLLLWRKELTNVKRSGALDKMKETYEGLREEKANARILQEKSYVELEKHKTLLEEKHKIQQTIQDMEQYRRVLKFNELRQLYEELRDYQEKIQTTNQAIEEIDGKLYINGLFVDEKKLKDMDEQHIQVKQLVNTQEELLKKKKEIDTALEEKNTLLQIFVGYKGLEENIERQVAESNREKIYAQEKLTELQRHHEDLETLKTQLEHEKSTLDIEGFEIYEPTLEAEIIDKENKLKELHNKLSDSSKRDHLLFKRDILKRNGRVGKAMLGLGLLAAVGGSLGGNFISPYLLTLCGLGLLLSIIGFLQIRKASSQTKALELEIAVVGDGSEIRKEIEEITRELRRIYEKLGVRDYHDFKVKLTDYLRKINKIEEIKIKIQAKQNYTDDRMLNDLKEKMERSDAFISTILKNCKREDIEGFYEGLKKYRELNQEKTYLEKEVGETENRLKNLSQTLEDLHGKSPWMSGNDSPSSEKIQQELDALRNHLRVKNELERKKNALESTFSALQKDTSIEALEKELSRYHDVKKDLTNISMDKDMEALDEELKNLHESLIQMEKDSKDLQYAIDGFTNKIRDSAEIEEDIILARDRIKTYQHTLDAVDIATEVLEESFQEIQKSFGPKLNRTVGDILQKITNGKYTELKISDSFKVKVVDAQADKIKDVEYYSNGTWDQVYFSLRMGLVSLMFDQRNSTPIFLDDAFIQYDDERLEAVLSFLHEYARDNQVILMTCQKREMHYFKGYDDVNILTL
ncbi:MAG: ATP-binding protein [Bacillota bacterium]